MARTQYSSKGPEALNNDDQIWDLNCACSPQLTGL